MARNTARSMVGYSGQQSQIARNIRRLYEEKKKELGLTQSKVADQLKCTQAAVSQQLRGIISLSNEQKLIWAGLLETSPDQIDPSLKPTEGLAQTTFTKVEVPVMYALKSGRPAVPSQRVMALDVVSAPGNLFGIEVQSDLVVAGCHIADGGDIILVDPVRGVRIGTRIAIFMLDGKISFGRYARCTNEKLECHPYSGEKGVVTAHPLDKVRAWYAVDSIHHQ